MAQLYALSSKNGMKAVPVSQMEAGFFSGSSPDAALISPLDAYNKVGWLYRAVNVIAETLSGLPYDFHDLRTDDVIEDGASRLRFPFDFETVMNTAAGDMTLFGAAYWIMDLNAASVMKDLRRLHPSTMRPIYDPANGLIEFKRQVNGREFTLPLDSTVHVWHPNREAEMGPGVPPAYAALHAAGVLHQIDVYGANFFANGATTPTLVYLDDNQALLSENEVKQFQGWLDRIARGTNSAFKSIFVRSKIGQVTLGSAPKDLEMPGLTDKKREDIATALGVPHSLLFSNAANFATASQDDLHFYDKTVIPLGRRIVSALSEAVFEPLGMVLKIHPERLEVFQKLEGAKATALATARDRRVISINEMREEIGFSKLDEALYDDVSYAPPVAASLVNLPLDQVATPDQTLDQARERLRKHLSDQGKALPERAATRAHAEDCACAACAADEEASAAQELKQWQRFTLKRVRAGKPIRAFDAEHLTASQKAAIEAQIEGLTDEASIRLIFSDAARWLEYP